MSELPATSSGLRPYQAQCLEAIRNGWKDARSLLVSAPTGSGKTVIFAYVAAEDVEAGRKVLVLAHREELQAQAQNWLKRFCGCPPRSRRPKPWHP
ncbi:DEAD/DEAH box helicase [Verrucomicrobium sp. 3C]|uniref:DEAD/DEAH box helicase n=1 Tax=Verrucomicrobium sp. 3C TaxID=1134055 RepID=UPI001E305C1B|nr:DEAD/DEAH box helicase family protein [Verrucomicrobium sp. 3C]